jgi:hypothetical protein
MLRINQHVTTRSAKSLSSAPEFGPSKFGAVLLHIDAERRIDGQVLLSYSPGRERLSKPSARVSEYIDEPLNPIGVIARFEHLSQLDARDLVSFPGPTGEIPKVVGIHLRRGRGIHWSGELGL